jgi:hypothetical protein
MKICVVCREELDETWFGWEKDKCMECVLDTLEIDDE